MADQLISIYKTVDFKYCKKLRKKEGTVIEINNGAHESS